jgi:hypothetical protein
MTYATRATGSIDRLARHFGAGDSITVRRSHSLTDPAAGNITTLAVNGLTAQGESSIDLDATRLEGTLPAGITFTIAGDGTTYTVASDVTAASNALSSVSFTPVLAAEAADDAVVTLATTFKDYTFLKSKRGFMERDIGDTVDASDRKLIVSALGAEIVPTEDDQILEHGEVLDVKEIRPVKPGDTEAGYVIWVKG